MNAVTELRKFVEHYGLEQTEDALLEIKKEAKEVEEEVNVKCKFIITDPCYIMNEVQYYDICAKGCDFEGQDFPLESTHRDSGKKIVFHRIEGTPNGDGSYIYKGRDIGVDAGMLCIAEAVEGDFSGEKFGALFSTLGDARSSFNFINSKF